ncbi:MAG: hypothetical protein M1819_001305 [Sarea resinae]|nr:MAG: hypothetical protein M1819_001305 [Sarea resinae]
MFGAICAGRPVQTNLQTISPTQFAFTIPASPSFNHIVVFLLPGNSLPGDMAAAVYIQIPPSPDFKLLGAIDNSKQSAIFKVNHLGTSAQQSGDDAMIDETMPSESPAGTGTLGPNIILGISVEPAANIGAQLASAKGGADGQSQTMVAGSNSTELVRRPPSTRVLAQRIIKNAFNFLASFAAGQGGSEVIPLRSFQDWWTKFEKRIELDPGFLERDEA